MGCERPRVSLRREFTVARCAVSWLSCSCPRTAVRHKPRVRLLHVSDCLHFSEARCQRGLSSMADDAPAVTPAEAATSSPAPLPPEQQPHSAAVSATTEQAADQVSSAPSAPEDAVTSTAPSPTRGTTPLVSFPSASLLRSVDIAPVDATVSAASVFYKGVSWSPDGTCLLTAAEDHVMRLYEVQTLMQPEAPPSSLPPLPSSSAASSELPVLTVGIGETVYDYSWFPRMHSSDPASCCFITTARDLPCQLWDAFTGQLRVRRRRDGSRGQRSGCS